MEILEIIQAFEDALKDAKQPLMRKDQIILDESEVYAFLDKLRNNLPAAIQDAQWVKQDEERIITAAHDEHSRIIAEAKERAQAMVDQHEITAMATAQGEDIVQHARSQAHEITEGAFNYAHDILSKLENQLTVYYELLQEGRADIQKSLDAMRDQSYEIEYRPDEEVQG